MDSFKHFSRFLGLEVQLKAVHGEGGSEAKDPDLDSDLDPGSRSAAPGGPHYIKECSVNLLTIPSGLFRTKVRIPIRRTG